MIDKEKYPKSKFNYIVYIVEQREDTGEMKVVDTIVTTMSGKSYRDACVFSNRTPVVVNEKPNTFKINEQYMLATRDTVWTWTTREVKE